MNQVVKNQKNTVMGMEKDGRQLYFILLHPECNLSTCHVPVCYIKVDLFQTDWQQMGTKRSR